MLPAVTIGTITLRPNPQFQAMANGIACNLQRMSAPFEWIVVDGMLWYDESARRDALRRAVNDRFSFRHVFPKPTVWQGPHRLTKRDYFDMCSARNTVFIHAEHPYVIFLDDCTVPAPEWLQDYAQGSPSQTTAGTYVSVHSLKQDENGAVVDFDPVQDFQDHRLLDQPQGGPCQGGWMYSGNLGVPLDVALAVNGYDEEYSGQGSCGDCDFGIRVRRFGSVTMWNPNSVTYQIMATHTPILAHHGNCDPYETNAEAAPQKMRVAFGHRQRANVWLLEKLSKEPERVLPLGNPFILTELRALVGRGELLPVPKTPIIDWRDGQLLQDM